MNYIIDPAWFYWVNAIDTINTVLLAVMLISCIFTISVFIMYYFCCVDEEDYKQLKKLLIALAIITLIFIVLYIFCPDKKTMIEMQVARFATYENAEWTVETVKNAVDYIAQAIKSLK